MSAAEARAVQRRQIPLALLMVGLTALTLWSLGQTIVETPQAADHGRPVAPVDDARRPARSVSG